VPLYQFIFTATDKTIKPATILGQTNERTYTQRKHQLVGMP